PSAKPALSRGVHGHVLSGFSEPDVSRLARTARSRPAHARHRRLDRDDLAGAFSKQLGNLLETTPLGDDDEQGAAIVPAEHAGEGAAIELHAAEDLTALADADASLAGDIGEPDRTVSVHADAIRAEAGRAGRGTATGQAGGGGA